jgi:hypothetical protein
MVKEEISLFFKYFHVYMYNTQDKRDDEGCCTADGRKKKYKKIQRSKNKEKDIMPLHSCKN